MPSTTFLTPRRRDGLIALVAVVLLAAPIWVPALHLDDPTYRYERVAVTVNGAALSFSNESAVPAGAMLSNDIACSGPSSRACAFERHLSRNHAVLTGIYSTRPGAGTEPYDLGPDRYDYVQIEDTLYEPITLANRSRVYVVENGTAYEKGTAPPEAEPSGDVYRNELALRPASPSEALADISRGVDDVQAPIRRAAQSGHATTAWEVEPPKTPIRTGDSTYYRVFQTSQRQPLGQGGTELLLIIAMPALGAYGAYHIRNRLEVNYRPCERSGSGGPGSN